MYCNINITQPVTKRSPAQNTNCSLSDYKKKKKSITNESDRHKKKKKSLSTGKSYFDDRLCARDHGCSRWDGLDVGGDGWYGCRCDDGSLRRLRRRARTWRGRGGRGQCWSLLSFCQKRFLLAFHAKIYSALWKVVLEFHSSAAHGLGPDWIFNANRNNGDGYSSSIKQLLYLELPVINKMFKCGTFIVATL